MPRPCRAVWGPACTVLLALLLWPKGAWHHASGTLALLRATVVGGHRPTTHEGGPYTKRPRVYARAEPQLTVGRVVEAGVPLEVADKIVALREAIAANGSEPLADPLTLLRFYNARKGDVDKAADMHRNAVHWRSRASLQRIMQLHGEGEEYTEDGWRESPVDQWRWLRHPKKPVSKLVARHVAFVRMPVLSPDSEPIMVWRFKADDFDLFVKEDLKEALIESYIAHIEDTLQTLRAMSIQEKHLVRARFVIDVKGCGLWSIRYLPSLKKATSIGQRYFPEIVTSVTVVRAPVVATFVYNLIKAFMPLPMQRKISILDDDFEEGLTKQSGLDMSHLPAYIGGGLDVELS